MTTSQQLSGLEKSALAPTATPATTPLRLAMLGMIAGNGHPYSWSGIINGYPFADTVELMTLLIAGIRSRREHSRRVPLAEIKQELSS